MCTIFIMHVRNCVMGATVVPRPLSNDPRLNQCIYCYGRASKRFVEVYANGFLQAQDLYFSINLPYRF